MVSVHALAEVAEESGVECTRFNVVNDFDNILQDVIQRIRLSLFLPSIDGAPSVQTVLTLLQSIPSASKKEFTVQNTSIPRVVESKATTQQLILEISIVNVTHIDN